MLTRNNYLCIDISNGKSRHKLMTELKKKETINGTYATAVCSNCGIYCSSPNGSVDNLIVTKYCKHCFNEWSSSSWNAFKFLGWTIMNKIIVSIVSLF